MLDSYVRNAQTLVAKSIYSKRNKNDKYITKEANDIRYKLRRTHSAVIKRRTSGVEANPPQKKTRLIP